MDIYAHLENTNGGVGRLFENQWDPGHSSGTNGRGWGKSNDTRDSNGPDLCWAMSGDVGPISLQDMTAQEKEVGRPESMNRAMLTWTGLCR